MPSLFHTRAYTSNSMGVATPSQAKRIWKNAGIIIGSVIAGILCLFILRIVYCRYRRKKSDSV
ncbi:hypothetical protein K505DRAFT_365632 [Melanomma pulvis-pyrius CBS 109.77]|uniref:Uncharacterized protein n=1 Tax=Melanomma pulvis-pyrius CBS 109.77 TaxID=1314802 RepID=A0A6A6WZQ7_9PLEO|nr:hypothetical protein K505DRAFT_365632 [Melanomma pulvis-pyrius CBS 109.77]